ncbi:hypothetical protein VW35_06095 [Devosia soli]|uniref:Uncharacterized protein n=1 Tax=Devosia soli TaxID=361041 RepID=A0A0F5LEM4_9HYPH|nr:hypothetical protein [Devosia soli]KKB80022.1 hypothetical protein VW35_06095 [Devosia soli]
MTIKSALSVVALTVAFTGAAFAQGMMINGVAVSAEDQPAVQERCDQLSNAATTESLAPTTEDGEASNTPGADTNSATSTTAADATLDNAPTANATQNATTTIDLDTITLEACTEGGFVKM